jgi:tetratricopeptide (TPR) repeat protein
MALGSVLNDLGEKEEAQAQYHRDLAFYREIGYRWGEGVATGNLGSLAMGRGRLREALERYRRALDIDREIGRRGGEGADALNLGRIYLALGDAEEAERHGRLSRQCAQEAGDRYHEGFALHLLAGVARRRRDLKDAAWLYEGALRLRRELPHPPGVARTLLRLGQTMLSLQRRRQGIELLVEAAESKEEVGAENAAVLAVARLAVEREAPAEEAAMLLAEATPRMTLLDRLEAEQLLYRATDGPRRLRNARELLRDLVTHAPSEYRERMLRDVPLYREIG